MVQLSGVVATALALVTSVAACWEQCGGQGWSGSTTCASPCVCTYSNDWYSQCLPPTSSSSLKASSSSLKASSSSARSSSSLRPSSSARPSSVPPSSSRTSSTPRPSQSGSPTKYWFSFGDSYTQTGFEVTSTLPNSGNVFGNPPYPGYTACGSYVNWINLVTVKYNHTAFYTYNFAYGGATIDAALVTPYTSTVRSLTDQVNQFLSVLGNKPSSTPWTSSTAMFSFFIGINDIGNSYYQSGDRSAFSDTLLNAYFALVQKIYNAGGRNFLFINVPGVDRSPMMLSQGTSATSAEKTVIDTFNTKLAAKIAAFKSANAGTSTWLYDANAKLVQILNSPSSYGFRDATTYSSATDVCWCNNYHISPGVHELYAKDIGTLINGSGW